MANNKEFKIADVLSKYTISEPELKLILREFRIDEDKIPKKLLPELVQVVVAPVDKTITMHQEANSWYRGEKWIDTCVVYGEKKWITKSELKVMDRQGIPTKGSKRTITDREGNTKTINTKIQKRFNITKIVEFVDFKI